MYCSVKKLSRVFVCLFYNGMEILARKSTENLEEISSGRKRVS